MTAVLKHVIREAARYLRGSEHSLILQRQHLRALDDRMLEDNGLTRADALRGRLLGLMRDDREDGTTMTYAIRDTRENDLGAVQAIYAYHVLHSSASFEEEPPSFDEMNRRHADVRERGLPHLVAEQDGRIVGYSYATPYRARSAYRFTVENSVYVDRDLHGAGIGRALLSSLIARCEEGDWRQMIAVIGDSTNAASIGLHASLGFRPIGTLHAVGFKFGRWLDTVLMQRDLGTRHREPCMAPSGKDDARAC